MNHSAKKVNAYVRKIEALKREALALRMEVRIAINNSTELHRLAIEDMIERRIRDGVIETAEYLPLQTQIQAEITAMIADAQKILAEQQEAAFMTATNKARELVLEAGGTFFSPSTNQLVIAQKFSADLVTGLTADALKQVNSILSATALGGFTPYDAMKKMDEAIGIRGASGVSYKSETIVRTEVHRIYSVALDAQFESFLQSGVDRQKVKKRWVSGPDGPGRRVDHQDMDGEEVEYDQPFIMPSGNLLMFPGDPGGAAEDVINCGCGWVLSADSIEDAVLSAIETL